MKKRQDFSRQKGKSASLETSFAEVVDLIQQARQRTFHAVNTELIDLFNPPKVSAALRQLQPVAENIFKDTYLIDFLDLPEKHDETDCNMP